jgi:hypothetical protein
MYTVVDPFLRLWFGCVYPYESLFEFGSVESGVARIRPLLERHVASVFEELCREYVRRRPRQFHCAKVGRQWGRHYEIDVAGVDEHGHLAVLGECKWSEQKVGGSVVRELAAKVSREGLPTSEAPTFLLFSKSGFTPDLHEEAGKRGDLLLVDSILAA